MKNFLNSIISSDGNVFVAVDKIGSVFDNDFIVIFSDENNYFITEMEISLNEYDVNENVSTKLNNIFLEGERVNVQDLSPSVWALFMYVQYSNGFTEGNKS